MSLCYLSTSCFRDTNAAEAIETASQYSDNYVEISAPHNFEKFDDLRQSLIRQKDQGKNLVLHNYFPAPKEDFVLNIATQNHHEREKAKHLISNALSLSKDLSSRVYGIHAGYKFESRARQNGNFEFFGSGIANEDALTNATKFVCDIAPDFELSGVRLLIENLFPSKQINHSLFCSTADMRDFFDLVPKSVGLLLDLGHLNITCNLWNLDRKKTLINILEKFSDRIFEVHLSENLGENDDHLAVQEGSWQLWAIGEILRATKASIIFCLESRNSPIRDTVDSIYLINDTLTRYEMSISP